MNIINEIDNYLLNKEREKKKRESYYPSEVSHCIRQSYYKWTDEKISDPIPAGGLWKMAMGNKIHDLINEFLIKAGWEIKGEVEFKQDIGLKYPLSGRIDNIFIHDGIEKGIEVKSSYGNGIREMKKTGWPRKDDAEQVFVYMFFANIKEFYLVYIARDDGYRMQFQFDYRDDKLCCNGRPVKTTKEELIDRYRQLEQYIYKKQLPGRQYKAAIKNGEIKKMFQKDNIKYSTEWQCGYCIYRSHCWKDELIKYKDSDNSIIFKEEENG